MVKSVNFNFSAKSSNIDYNKSNKPNPKSLAHGVWEIACWTWSSKKCAFKKIEVKDLIYEKLWKTLKNSCMEVNTWNVLLFSDS